MKKRWNYRVIGLIFSITCLGFLLFCVDFACGFFDSFVSICMLSLLIIINAFYRAKEQHEYKQEENRMKPYFKKE